MYSKASNLSESGKEKYVPEVAPSYGAGTDYTQVQTCNSTNKCKNRLAKIADLNQKWIQTKASMAVKNCDLPSKKQIIRKMVETGTELLHASDGEAGNVAVGIRGTLVSPPVSVRWNTILGSLKASQQ